MEELELKWGVAIPTKNLRAVMLFCCLDLATVLLFLNVYSKIPRFIIFHLLFHFIVKPY